MGGSVLVDDVAATAQAGGRTVELAAYRSAVRAPGSLAIAVKKPGTEAPGLQQSGSTADLELERGPEEEARRAFSVAIAVRVMPGIEHGGIGPTVYSQATASAVLDVTAGWCLRVAREPLQNCDVLLGVGVRSASCVLGQREDH